MALTISRLSASPKPVAPAETPVDPKLLELARALARLMAADQDHVPQTS